MLARSTVRCRLQAQGFGELDDATVAELGPWMRWAPALCAVFMLAGTLLASAPLLWGLAGVALLGALFPRHPFDLLYNHAVRHLTGTRPLPRHGPQRRFACGVAAVWLAGTGLAFHQGATALGAVLGGAITAVATLVAVTHFCIPSLVYNTLSSLRLARRPGGERRLQAPSVERRAGRA
jgi:hypothetical protein